MTSGTVARRPARMIWTSTDFSDPAPMPEPPPGLDPVADSARPDGVAAPARDPDLRLEMWSQPRLLSAARGMVDHLARRVGFDEVTSGQISLAIDEALCNVINHGYERRPDGRIVLSIWAEADLLVVIEDRAREVDPDTIRGRDLDDIRPGGLGVHIIREVMDLVRYEQRPGGGMRLTLSKRAGCGGQPAADARTEALGDG